MRTVGVKDWNAWQAGNVMMTYTDSAGDFLQTGFVSYKGSTSAYGDTVNASQLAFFDLQKKLA